MTETIVTIDAEPDLHPFQPLQSARFSGMPGLRHGFTRRIPTEPLAEANISYSAPRNQYHAWAMRQRWCRALGIDPTTLTVARQVHGSDVFVATREHAGTGAMPETPLVASADGIVTAETGVALMTTHADCLPLLLVEPRTKVIGAVHAGWRSTVADVAGNTIRLMKDRFGARPAEILGFIGPAICAACYEIGADVTSAWLAIDPQDDAGALRTTSGRTTFDLEAANLALLERAGVSRHHIETSGICTRCQGHEWFSHRGHGPMTGRFGAIIAWDPDCV